MARFNPQIVRQQQLEGRARISVPSQTPYASTQTGSVDATNNTASRTINYDEVRRNYAGFEKQSKALQEKYQYIGNKEGSRAQEILGYYRAAEAARIAYRQEYLNIGIDPSMLVSQRKRETEINNQLRDRELETTQTASAPSPRLANTNAQNTYTGFTRAQTGVYRGGGGEQVVILQGRKAKNAGELLTQLKSAQRYEPVQAKNSLIKDKVVGVVSNGVARTSKRQSLSLGGVATTNFLTVQMQARQAERDKYSTGLPMFTPSRAQNTPLRNAPITSTGVSNLIVQSTEKGKRLDDQRYAYIDKRIQALQARENKFYGSKGFERAKRTGELIGLTAVATNLFVSPKERGDALRSLAKGTDPITFKSKTAAITGASLTSGTLSVFPALYSAGEKIELGYRAGKLRGGKQTVQREKERALGETFSTVLNPKTPQGASTYLLAGGFALMSGTARTSKATVGEPTSPIRVVSRSSTKGKGSGVDLPILKGSATRIRFRAKPQGIIRNIAYKEAKVQINVNPQGIQTTKTTLFTRFYGKARTVVETGKARAGTPQNILFSRARVLKRETAQLNDQTLSQAIGTSRILRTQGEFLGREITGEVAQRSVATTQTTIKPAQLRGTLQSLAMRQEPFGVFPNKDIGFQKGIGKNTLALGNEQQQLVKSVNRLNDGFKPPVRVRGGATFFEKEQFVGISRTEPPRSRLRVDTSERAIYRLVRKQKQGLLPKSRRGQFSNELESLQRQRINVGETRAVKGTRPPQLYTPRVITSQRPLSLTLPSFRSRSIQSQYTRRSEVQTPKLSQIADVSQITIQTPVQKQRVITIQEPILTQEQRLRTKQITEQTFIPTSFNPNPSTPTPPTPLKPIIPFALLPRFLGQSGTTSGKGSRRGFAPSRNLYELIVLNQRGSRAKSMKGGFTGLEITRSYSPKSKKRKRRSK